MPQDQRRRPRHEKRLPVGFLKRLPAEIEGMEFHTTNVSAGGVQIACPSLWIELISAPLSSGILEARIQLPDKTSIHAVTEVRYHTDYGDDHLIGLMFKTFADDEQDRWLAFVDTLTAD